jgi:hypothetical protein
MMICQNSILENICILEYKIQTYCESSFSSVRIIFRCPPKIISASCVRPEVLQTQLYRMQMAVRYRFFRWARVCRKCWPISLCSVSLWVVTVCVSDKARHLGKSCQFYAGFLLGFLCDPKIVATCTSETSSSLWPARRYNPEDHKLHSHRRGSLQQLKLQLLNISDYTRKKEIIIHNLLSRFGVTIDGVWIEYWIYWPLLYTTGNYILQTLTPTN